MFQIMSLFQCFELCAEESDVALLGAFRKVKGVLKIITLHQPADILRYNISSYGDLSDALIRDIMRCRIEFSREAISKLKLAT
jgi:hypothetical protein